VAAPGQLHYVDEDVVPHLVNDLSHGQASAFPGVETELLDQMLQARVTENLLGHALQAILEVGDNIGRHILHRHLLLLDEDQGFRAVEGSDRKSTRLNSSHQIISYAVFCLKKKKKISECNLQCNY